MGPPFAVNLFFNPRKSSLPDLSRSASCRTEGGMASGPASVLEFDKKARPPDGYLRSIAATVRVAVVAMEKISGVRKK